MVKKESSMSDNGKSRTWTNKLVFGLVMVALTVVITIIFTPVGEWFRELIFPTSVVVEGFVQNQSKPAPGIKVVLDDKTTTTTASSGRFVFENVFRGTHYLMFFNKSDQLLSDDKFIIMKGQMEKKLGTIILDTTGVLAKRPEMVEQLAPNPAFVVEQKQPDYLVDLMYEATFIPLEERRPGFESNTHRIRVTVQATYQNLSRIERVTYYLHPTFKPSVVTRYSPENNFALSFTAWGQFELKAKVYFKDGQVKDLSTYLSF